jgi:hypothetical protein
MNNFCHTGLSRRLASLVILSSYLLSCTSWHRANGSPSQVLEERKQNVVRVSVAGGGGFVLFEPQLQNDSLIGTLIPNRYDRRRAIPVDSIVGIEVRQLSKIKTTVALVGAGLTILAIAAILTAPDPQPQQEHPSVSCPMVYSWDGKDWRLDSGTFGGAIMPIFARTDVDNLMYATAQGDQLRLRMANELNETDYVDAISVLIVDHSPSVTVAPSADGTIHTLGPLQQPRSAVDFRGHFAMDRVRSVDGWAWESRPSGRDTSDARDVRDGLELVFAKPRGATRARLVVDGSNTPWAAHMVQELVRAHGRTTQVWYDSVNGSPVMARKLAAMMAREGFLDVQLRVGGRWEHRDFLWEAGPEVMKRQVVSLDLSGIEGDVVEIRLESAPMFWLIDNVGLDFSDQLETRPQELKLERAVDQDGRDVRSKLQSLDKTYHVLKTGDRTELSFRVPTAPAGMKRSYLLRSTGWYHITAPQVKEPDLALLDEVKNRPRGASRVSVARFNDALRALNAPAK